MDGEVGSRNCTWSELNTGRGRAELLLFACNQLTIPLPHQLSNQRSMSDGLVKSAPIGRNPPAADVQSITPSPIRQYPSCLKK
ncbi:hypothetical protein T07_189 [Trichinella nelsoni]|uniref:Uncharacterized protein n=3 Tax=Trichinella TaxID=6333 RepID=A0A0V1CEZ7_TRIBR|nr:hypothetical protein T07_189 [Trichinella nelsoni]KRY18007.1 hypothetical protein T12_2134 [Trichinella patagoniensis]KRY47899.1 hypothetical protein T03_13754 [Trichinella britovi]